jgi:CO/xanthine dehydrogenase FAD-binding subunit
MEDLVRSKLAADRVIRLQQARERLKEQPAEPMTVQEINAEIKAYRQGQRLATSS